MRRARCALLTHRIDRTKRCLLASLEAEGDDGLDRRDRMWQRLHRLQAKLCQLNNIAFAVAYLATDYLRGVVA